jgi:hypothetical protein
MEIHEFSKCADDIINHFVMRENPPDKDEWCRHLVQEQKILQDKIMNEHREQMQVVIEAEEKKRQNKKAEKIRKQAKKEVEEKRRQVKKAAAERRQKRLSIQKSREEHIIKNMQEKNENSNILIRTL